MPMLTAIELETVYSALKLAANSIENEIYVHKQVQGPTPQGLAKLEKELEAVTLLQTKFFTKGE